MVVSCPYCLEPVQAHARKCRHCGSNLGKDAERAGETVFIADRGLIRFAKFAAAFLAIFIVIGTYVFGYDVRDLVGEMRDMRVEIAEEHQRLAETRAELLAATDALAVANEELTAARADIDALRTEASASAARAEAHVVTIEGYLTRAGLLITQIEAHVRELSPDEQAVADAARAELLLDEGSASREAKLWPIGHTLRIAFLGGTTEQHTEVERFAREWEAHANIAFEFGLDPSGAEIRVAFEPDEGTWSFVGTDALAVPHRDATMNLGSLTRQDIVHEFGHVLGLLHEHVNPSGGPDWNRETVIADMSGAPTHWSRARIEASVFRKATDADYPGARPYDSQSIMGYAFPAAYVATGPAPTPGDSLSESDEAYIRSLYPPG